MESLPACGENVGLGDGKAAAVGVVRVDRVGVGECGGNVTGGVGDRRAEGLTAGAAVGRDVDMGMGSGGLVHSGVAAGSDAEQAASRKRTRRKNISLASFERVQSIAQKCTTDRRKTKMWTGWQNRPTVINLNRWQAFTRGKRKVVSRHGRAAGADR
jgi:hypothetical protein